MPENLDVGPTYTLRITAVSPTDGSLVSGVKVNTVVLTCDQFSDTGDTTDLGGNWFLVPGPGA
jgi:hypothetical protein